MSLNNTTNTEILLDTDIGHIMRLEIFAIIVKFVNTKKYNNQNLVATYTQISGESPKALLAERVGRGVRGSHPRQSLLYLIQVNRSGMRIHMVLFIAIVLGIQY